MSESAEPPTSSDASQRRAPAKLKGKRTGTSKGASGKGRSAGAAGTDPAGVAARKLAIQTLVRIEQGAYANTALPAMLERSELAPRDRAFVTGLVYGTVRMQRAVDWLAGRYVSRDLPTLDPEVRAGLRLGAYQLRFLGTPPHAAVSATVDAVGGRARGMINAVLRKVAADDDPAWPSDGIRLSYPEWIIRRLRDDLGDEHALGALEAMNTSASAVEREDGYVQDLASQWVAGLVGAEPGEVVIDLCAAPGGKATAMAASGASVLAADLHPARARMMARNEEQLAASPRPGLDSQVGAMVVVIADGTAPPVRPGSVDKVLVDAPCTGLGALRRRPDARWRITEDAVDRLVALQQRLLIAAAELVKPGGTLVYSVCTLTDAETLGIDRWAADALPGFVALDRPGEPWAEHGRGARLLPQAAETDGMTILRLQRT